MNKTIITEIALVFLVLAFTCSVHTSQAADGLSSPIIILSPTHQTYNSTSPIPLKTQIVGLGGSTFYYSMTYSLDGQTNVTLPFTTQTHERSFQLTMTGQTTLPQLTEGIHNITAYQGLEAQFGTSAPFTLWDSSTVNFTVNDGAPPAITILSPENRTYSQDSLLLNYSLDEPALWAGYCLDNQANVTINENTTITNLSAGSHRFQVFANDTAGNVGASSISNFTITKENSVNDILYNQASLVVLAIVIVIVAVASVSLVYFKRRKWKLASKQN